MSRYIRLGKNGFIFRDRQTGFSIEKGETKPLPAILGDLTRKWLQAGGLELCESPKTSAPSDAPVVDDMVETKPEVKSRDSRVAELEACEIATLRKMCVEKSLRFGYRSSKASLITKIVDNEYGG